MIRDILHLSKAEIYELDLVAYEEALNYALITYRLRMATQFDPKAAKNGETIFFEQPLGFDRDPTFVSKV